MFFISPLYTFSKTIHRHFQWIIVDSRVYDVSKFANLHPGGAAVLLVDSIGNTYSLPRRVEALIDVTLDSG
jgi:hypothetical protein